MKNPLTSKERRGLAAVAAAALLCISSGFVVRSCGYHGGQERRVVVRDIRNSSDSLDNQDSTKRGKKSDKIKKAKTSKKKNGKSSKKNKAEKSYPVRDPLSQPCD